MRIIGLTGGIASGKSTVAQLLRRAGVPVIDADALAREVVLPGAPALAEIAERFGGEVLAADGGLDRKKLGARVFANAAERAQLNAIVHPRVQALALQRLDALRATGAPVAVYEVPLLFENALEHAVDATLLVATSLELQRARLMARDGIDASAADARIAAQMSLAEKRARATRVIENDGHLDDTARQLRAAWRELTGSELHA